MKTTLKSKKKKAASPSLPQRGPTMNGAEVLVASLEREGVDTIFAYPGGASQLLHQALTKSKKIRTILPRHEQGGVFMAGGYARSTGKVGVCMATSGPGATNLVTGLADAFMDSIPVVSITGQVPSYNIGKGAFQETDFFGMTLPVVKHSYLVLDARDIPRIIKEAFYIANSGRPGPVVVDIPKDVQMAMTQPLFPGKVELRGYKPEKKADDLALNELLGLIEKAEKPVLYVGGGIISSGAAKELLEFAELTNIPVTTTLMGIGCFPEDHPLSLKWLGMHGTYYANRAVNEADLLLAFGVRFDDRVTGKVSEFAKHGTIVHVDIDYAEFDKNKHVHLPILSDVKYALERLNAIIRKENRARKTFPAWQKDIETWRAAHPLKFHNYHDKIAPQLVIQKLWEMTKGEAIITTGVGQHQMWAGQFYTFTRPRTFLTSGGLGAMGFGYPAALGAKVACPNKQVIDIDGDGSFLMNVQELATAKVEKIHAKIIILNNQHLGMVVQWEDRFFQSNRGHTYLGDPSNRSAIYPDYPAIFKGFDIPCERVGHKHDLDAALQRLLDAKGSYALDIMVPYTEHVLPMIPANKTFNDIITD
ncbi:MAG TPA: biosynthetic-type acetolactate synthase large subunit [Candidatus Methylacidiphilales bacterium]|nr:biosynthetic-type acetolactate synthase large subunit [Candidatus Methylacidiphilales bacterium]